MKWRDYATVTFTKKGSRLCQSSSAVGGRRTGRLGEWTCHQNYNYIRSWGNRDVLHKNVFGFPWITSSSRKAHIHAMTVLLNMTLYENIKIRKLKGV